jgi:hypothetical protein
MPVMLNVNGEELEVVIKFGNFILEALIKVQSMFPKKLLQVGVWRTFV